jgi:hypothetical protein
MSTKITNVVNTVIADSDFIFMMEKVVGSFKEATEDDGFLILTFELHAKSATSTTKANASIEMTINLRKVPGVSTGSDKEHQCCGTGCCDHESDGGS